MGSDVLTGQEESSGRCGPGRVGAVPVRMVPVRSRCGPGPLQPLPAGPGRAQGAVPVPGSAEPSSGAAWGCCCSRCRRRRSLSAAVTVMGCSGRNPASPARESR